MADRPLHVLILGGTGYIGRALASRLCKRGDCEVEALGSKDLDLKDSSSARQLLGKLSERTVLVNSTTAKKCTNTQAECLVDNVLMLRNLIDALRQRKIRKCIYLSSTSVYGDAFTELQIQEDTSPAPNNYYGISKLAGERMLKDVSTEQGTSLSILRACMIYGENDSAESYGPPQFINSLKRQEAISLYGDGSEHRNYLYLNDLVNILEQFVLRDLRGTFNVGADRSFSFTEIVEILKQQLGTDIPVKEMARDRPATSKTINVTKLKSTLKGIKFTPIAEGLRQTLGDLATQTSSSWDS